MMDITLAYAIGLGSSLALMILLKLIRHFTKIAYINSPEVQHPGPIELMIGSMSGYVSKHVAYPTVISRGKYIERWSRMDVALLMLYMGANISCLFIRSAGVFEAGLRAGMLSILNVALLFSGPHLSFLADVFGLSIRTYRRLHVCTGIMSILLAVFHAVATTATNGKFPLEMSHNLWALIVGKYIHEICYARADEI